MPRSLLSRTCGLALLLCAGCSQNNLLTRQDYQASQHAFVQGNVTNALLEFPRRAESRTFITDVELAYLSLIQGQPRMDRLQTQAHILENRLRYHPVRNAQTFFSLQTPEDYYASEHEVIWLHLLLSWGYSRQGRQDMGCIEARQASTLLSLPWNANGHFDDPALRLMLAAMWALCGEWKEARVDLRAAWFLDNRLTWARELADLEPAPADLILVLGGPGPEPEWVPDVSPNPLRSGRQIRFKLRGVKGSLSLADQSGKSVTMYRSPDAEPWYDRHLARESALHEVIADSVYGRQVASSATFASARIAATTGVGLAVGVGGTALGGAIIYAGGQSGSGDAINAGLLVMAYSITKGIEIAREGYQKSAAQLEQAINPSDRYRFVRYLPEYLWLGWSTQPVTFPLQLRTASSRTSAAQPLSATAPRVTIAFLPDTPVLRWGK